MSVTQTYVGQGDGGSAPNSTISIALAAPPDGAMLVCVAVAQENGSGDTPGAWLVTDDQSGTWVEQSASSLWFDSSIYQAQIAVFTSVRGVGESAPTLTIDPDTGSSAGFYSQAFVWETTGVNETTPFVQHGYELRSADGDASDLSLTLGAAPSGVVLSGCFAPMDTPDTALFGTVTGFTKDAERTDASTYVNSAAFSNDAASSATIDYPFLFSEFNYDIMGAWAGELQEGSAASDAVIPSFRYSETT